MKPLKLFGPKSLCLGAAALALVTVFNTAPVQAEPSAPADLDQGLS